MLHEYMALRKKVMGLETLNMYDLNYPMIPAANLALEFDEAFALVKEGLKPLGEEYQGLLQRAYDERWMDVYETPGKRSGAYSMGVYGVHPYVLLNYEKTTHDVSPSRTSSGTPCTAITAVRLREENRTTTPFSSRKWQAPATKYCCSVTCSKGNGQGYAQISVKLSAGHDTHDHVPSDHVRGVRGKGARAD